MMGGSTVGDAAATIFDALVSESETALKDVVSDLQTHVVQTMAMLARSLATIGLDRADYVITEDMANIEVRMAIRAAASVIVGFANETLLGIERIINAVLGAIKQVVNTAVGVAVL